MEGRGVARYSFWQIRSCVRLLRSDTPLWRHAVGRPVPQPPLVCLHPGTFRRAVSQHL
ncbi:hypothetical protein SBBP2_890037 [Burkholderiales bacterium]|nr:hypothetical protein SBBP2_890037 [Burkholderiales bacterium]